MLNKLLETQSLSIVFLGDFNPLIVTPFWLAMKGLIREEEAINANVTVIHHDLVRYNLDWIDIVINRKRCEFRTSKSPYFEAVRDLASSVFLILRETPINSIGINHIFELKLPDEKTVYNFGAQLANLDIWKDDLNNPRIMNLEIIENNRTDGYDGHYRVRVSPTGTEIPYGVVVNINDHINLLEDHQVASELITSHWEASFKRANKVVSSFLDKLEL